MNRRHDDGCCLPCVAVVGATLIFWWVAMIILTTTPTDCGEQSMNKSESIAALAKALAAAQGDIENPQKNAVNPHFRNRYADLAELTRATRPVFASHGLAISQWLGFEDGKVTVETILMHESGEWLSNLAATPAPKQDPQGIGSAQTYLRRYSWAAVCGVAQEDDDGHAASITTPSQPPEPPPAAEALLAQINSTDNLDSLRRIWQQAKRHNLLTGDLAAQLNAKVEAVKNAPAKD